VEVTEVVDQTERSWWTRVRAAGLLVLLLVGLGVAAAAVLGVLTLVLGTFLDQALG
jgi:hypothetical protein